MSKNKYKVEVNGEVFCLNKKEYQGFLLCNNEPKEKLSIKKVIVYEDKGEIDE